jgi:hypothetical protein
MASSSSAAHPTPSASGAPMSQARPTLPNSPPTTPLRIAKRDGSPAPGSGPASAPSSSAAGAGKGPVARRTSSSYTHLRKNNLVSKSPFKAGGAPAVPALPSSVRGGSPRKTSGEKRPRPLSAQVEPAEAARPGAYKRRQSRGLDQLDQLEPVSNSPFKRGPASADASPPLPPKAPVRAQTAPAHVRAASLEPDAPHERAAAMTMPPPATLPTSRLPVLMPPPLGTPTRSVLVTKRMHGPRPVGRVPSGSRARRKTVTFDERCDVVEFDRESVEISFNASAIDDDEDTEDDYFGDDYDGEDHLPAEEEDGPVEEPQDSYEHEPMRPDDSIVGRIDTMLEESRFSDDGDGPRTPTSRHAAVAENVDPDGIPYGRTHHAERAAVAHPPRHARTASIIDATPVIVPPIRDSTPPQQNVPATPASEGPLGRSTHTERSREARAEERAFETDVNDLPPSPSPRKSGSLGHVGGLIPTLDFGIPGMQTCPLFDGHC